MRIDDHISRIDATTSNAVTTRGLPRPTKEDGIKEKQNGGDNGREE